MKSPSKKVVWQCMNYIEKVGQVINLKAGD